MKKLWLAVILLAASGVKADGQVLPEFRLRLAISATDDVQNEVTSCVNRELRRLGDVTLVDDNPTNELQIIAMSLQNRGGTTTGVVFAVVVLEPMSVYVNALRETLTPTQPQEDILNYLAFSTNVKDLWLRVGSDDEIGEVCTAFVADFDVEHLEPVRAALRGG